MSGAELALAIVPLVIAVVEHHPTVLRKSKALLSSKSKNNQQLDFFCELHDELTLLHMTLNRIKNRSLLAGYDETEEEAIARALGNEAPHFQTILGRILRSINDLVSEKSIDLSQDDTVNPGAMLSKLEHFKRALDNKELPSSIRKRFRFTGNEKSRTVALDKIQRGTTKLERLLGPSMEIYDQPSRKSRKKATARRTRRHSEELYKKLSSKWPKSGADRMRHKTKLCLWNCCCADGCRDSDDSLDMVVCVNDTADGQPNWQESTIHVKERPSSRSEGQVRFANDTRHTSGMGAPARNDVEADSLCEMFQHARSANAKLQLIFRDGKLSQTKSKGMCLRIRNQQDVPLTSLLGDRNQTWTLRDKWVLAVVLAHAALHCPAGSWLRADWNKEHVSFFRRDATQQADLTRPFLTLDFENQSTVADPLGPHPTLLSLGILLLEINKGTAIERHHAREDMINGQPNIFTNLTTAHRLLDTWNGDLVMGYRKAVKACLDWDTAYSELQNEDFAQRMYETIVEPLELELQHGFGLSPEDLNLMWVEEGRK
ncbi:hypothetical protein BKA63DRAFT_571758 [Paraphoma chrysanthemicola]|nr:hypothetical protein BKA63DRAFT_571758 [Paraphoma chrysanthemicola]